MKNSILHLRAQINEELAKSNFDFVYIIEINLHLISQKMNHQAGLRIITKNQIQHERKKILSRSNLVENRNSIWGVCPPRHRLFCVTEAGHANWCHGVG